MKYQPPPTPVNVSQFWEQDPEYDGFFSKGARDKSIYYSPNECDMFLIPNHRYLFKEPWWERHPTQFWSEIVAYRIGTILGVNVPPAFVSTRIDPATGEIICGALIEWFYDSDAVEFSEYRDAGDFIDLAIKGFDRKRGTQHNFLSNIAILKIISDLKKHYVISENWLVEFIGFFLFDTVIGNTDRHQDNWGLLFEKNFTTPGAKLNVKLSPAYDNGTSLGYEITDEKLVNFESPSRRATYIKKGRHHIKDSIDGHRLGHLEFVEFVVREFPYFHDLIAEFFNVDMQKIADTILELTSFDIPIPLSEQRAKLMISLIKDRITFAKQILNET